MKKKWRELLYRSFDDELTAAEANELAVALSESAELRAEQLELQEMRTLVGQQKTSAFKPFFAARVMNRIENQNSVRQGDFLFFESLLSSFRPVILSAAILLMGLLTYNMTSRGSFSLSGALGTPEITVQQSIDPTTIFLLE